MTTKSKVATACVCGAMAAVTMLGATKVEAANPILPLWEHVPDGEPYIFEDPDNPGEYRIYLYGSHDIRITDFCGDDLVLWSAPVDNPSEWRYDGVIFEYEINGKKDVLYAPDVVEKIEDGKKVYYLYPNNQEAGRGSMVCKADRPDGPFVVCNLKKNIYGQPIMTETEGVLGFDPAVFVDDDGRVYGYWGFTQSMAAELDPETMATVKEGTEVVTNMIWGIPGEGNDYPENDFRFFEASSMRKIKDKYVFVYSRTTKDGEFGLPACNDTLAYAYGDNPLGPWTYGGTIIDARARETDENGNVMESMQPWGNTHGSILEVNGQWYVFYHRQTDNSLYARQAMVAPITVEVEEGLGGKVTISEGTVTSEGFEINGLDPFVNYSAGITSWHTGGAYVKATYEKVDSNPVLGIRNGSIVGYKNFNFDKIEAGTNVGLECYMIPFGVDATVDIMIDRPWENQGGKVVGSFAISKEDVKVSTKYTVALDGLDELEGKHAVYFVFRDGAGQEICQFNDFEFVSGDFVVGKEEGAYAKKPTAVPDKEEVSETEEIEEALDELDKQESEVPVKGIIAGAAVAVAAIAGVLVAVFKKRKK